MTLLQAPRRLRIVQEDMQRWVRFAEDFEPIASLVEPAWTESDAMSVLADWMMLNVEEITKASTKRREKMGASLRPDHDLFGIEASVRDWLVRQIFGEVEIRHTGPWPRITFCVTHARRQGDFPRLELRRLQSIFPAAAQDQPRLLFIKHECPKQCDDECCNNKEAHVWTRPTCIVCGAGG